MSGLIDFIVGAFKGDWDAAWKGLGEVFNGLKDMANAIFGDIIKIIEKVVGWIEKAVDALSGLFQKSNSASLDYSGYSGSSRSYSAYSAYATIPYKVPMLATGTVVPPRAGISYFGIGDNNHEPEVVSPLSTMKQAFMEALAESGLSGGGRDITVQMILNDRVFGQAVYKANNQEKQRVGVRMVSQNA